MQEQRYHRNPEELDIDCLFINIKKTIYGFALYYFVQKLNHEMKRGNVYFLNNRMSKENKTILFLIIL